jgi:hypothetical protein
MAELYGQPFPPSEFAADVFTARHLLNTTRNIALGTVNPDLTPHVTVMSAGFRSSVDPNEPPLELFSWSFPDTRHAENLEMSGGEVAFAVYRSFSSGKALNVSGQMERLPFEEIGEWFPTFNALRKMFRLGPRALDDFNPELTEYPKGFYCTTITGASISTQRCADGEHIGDVPVPIDLDLLRGFEQHKWRWRWFREIAKAAIYRAS